jgi:hypothetical protein
LEDEVETKLRAANLSGTFGGEKKRNTVLTVLGGLFILCVAIIGFLIFWDRSPPPQPIKVKSVEELRRQNAPEPKKPEPKKQVIPKEPFDYTLTNPQGVIQACGKAFSILVKPLPGWNIENVSCNTRQASVKWERGRNGTIGLLAAEAERIFPEQISTRINDRQFTATVRLPDSLPKTDRRWMSTEQGKASLVKSFESRGELESDMNRPSPPPDLPPNKHAPKPFIDFTFDTKRKPEEIVQYFNLPGLDLEQMTWNIEDGSWTYQGTLKLDD